MGVKQGMSELAGDIKDTFENMLKERPQYSKSKMIGVQLQTIGRFHRIDKIVKEFFDNFNPIYEKSCKMNFKDMSFSEQIDYCKFFFF